MSKHIKLTDELISAIQQEFIESVKKMKMFDGKLNYTKNFKWEGEDRAAIVFSAVAFAKMIMLVQNFTSEVAWHGVAYRSEKEKNKFYITDILVYPQVVTGSTVNTDQEAYQTWLYTHDDDVFNNIRMQGHSHVDFSTTPSQEDTTHQEKILSQIDDDMFYIFMIWNKKFERTIKIFDMANNTLYETADVDIFIGEDGCDLNAFLKDAKDLVKTKTYSYAGQSGSQYGQGGYQYGKQQQVGFQTQTASDKSKSKPKGGKKDKPDIGSSGKNYNYGGYYEDDDDDDYGGVYNYGGYRGK